MSSSGIVALSPVEDLVHSPVRFMDRAHSVHDSLLIFLSSKGVTFVHLLVKKSEKDPILIKPVVVNPLLKLPRTVVDVVGSTLSGLQNGHLPVLSPEGSGGVYFMLNRPGTEYTAVFKPVDEEPMAKNNPRGLAVSSNGEGLKRGTRVGQGAFREVAAYVLDHSGFSGVPPTAMVRCAYGEKGFKIGSLQKFVKNVGSCEDMGPGKFPVEEVHKIAVLDMRLANADRHAGNVLVSKEGEDGKVVLVPIDHGYCLPENFEDCTFEWLYWPQSRKPFNSSTIDYISSLDADKDISLLKTHGWVLSRECSRTIRISTMLLKKGASRGLTAYDIGTIMCRETVDKDSKIEKIVREAQDAVRDGGSESLFLQTVVEIMDSYLDGVVKI